MASLPERSYLRRLFITALVVITLVVLWQAVIVFLLLLLAGLLAIVLHAASTPLRNRTRLSERGAVAVTTLFLVSLLALLGWFFAPKLIEQAGQFSEALPSLIAEVRDLAQQVPLAESYLEQLLPEDSQSLEGERGNGQADPNDNGSTNQESIAPDDPVGSAINIVSTVVETTILFLFVVFAALFLALRPQLYKSGILQLVPQAKTQRAEEVIDMTVLTLRHWLLGQLVVMAIVGVLTTLGLWMLGVPLALLLGFIAGILEFVSLLGPITAAVPGILVALAVGPMTAVYAALLYLAIQQLESYAITPLVQQQAVHLPPVLTVTAVVLMHSLFGIVGAFVAVPLVVVLRVLVKMLYVQDVLGKDIKLEGTANNG